MRRETLKEEKMKNLKIEEDEIMAKVIQDDAVVFLERYNKWRTGADERTMDEAGITPSAVTASIRQVTLEVRRLRYQLAKCQVMREKLHASIRKAEKQKTETLE